MANTDPDDDDDETFEDDWSYGQPVDTDPARTNLVGGIASVNENIDSPWQWSIAQRWMRQRCSFTGTFGRE